MALEEKKTKTPRKNRAIKIVDGVWGEEISIYIQDYENPEIKITYLRKENDIYENVVKTFIRKDVEDLKIKGFVDWFWVEMAMQSVSKVNEIYQVVQGLLHPSLDHIFYVKNYTKRELRLNPLFQVKLPHPNYKEYKK
jgi:hypothetical protein